MDGFTATIPCPIVSSSENERRIARIGSSVVKIVKNTKKRPINVLGEQDRRIQIRGVGEVLDSAYSEARNSKDGSMVLDELLQNKHALHKPSSHPAASNFLYTLYKKQTELPPFLGRVIERR